MAQYIASSHLYETPNYYKRLKDLKLAKGNLIKFMAKGGEFNRGGFNINNLDNTIEKISQLKKTL